MDLGQTEKAGPHNLKKRRPKIYTLMEYPGLTINEQIDLMKELNIYSPEVENILKWSPKTCPECNNKYFPSGSHETRCWKCNREHRNNYMKKFMKRKYWNKKELS